MIKLPKFAKLGLDFVWFFLTFEFVVSLFSGTFFQVFDWSSAGAAGSAIVQLVFLIGAIMFVKNVLLPALKKRNKV